MGGIFKGFGYWGFLDEVLVDLIIDDVKGFWDGGVVGVVIGGCFLDYLYWFGWRVVFYVFV